MAENQEKVVANVPENTTKPKHRRGVTNETRSTSNLKFTEADATKQGLFVGAMVEANVTWATYGEDATGTPSFAGKAVPNVSLHFTSLHAKPNERRHVFLRLSPVESNVDTMPGGSKEWQVNQIFATIKHVLEVFYLKGRPLTEAEEDALCLPFDEVAEDGTYNPIEADEVLAGYRVVFENFVAMLNGTFSADGTEASGKPCYKDANGNSLRVFMKLLRYTKRGNKGWQAVGQNGDLAFPRFVGEGILELMNKADEPAKILKINPILESIHPQQVVEPKAPSMPNVPSAAPGFVGGGVPMGGAPTAPMGGYDPYQETRSDMPF